MRVIYIERLDEHQVKTIRRLCRNRELSRKLFGGAVLYTTKERARLRAQQQGEAVIPERTVPSGLYRSAGVHSSFLKGLFENGAVARLTSEVAKVGGN